MAAPIQYRRQGQRGILTLSEPLCIDDAGVLLAVVKRIVDDDKATTVTLNVGESKRFDTSVFQLLVVLKTELAKRGRTLDIETGSSVFANYLKVGGIV